MASLKEVKTKIVGVKKTAQITKAMNMVASAKLRGAQEKMEAFRPYTAKFNEAMSNLSGRSSAGGSYPLMEKRQVKSVELVVINSDRGLCGSFNSNIGKLAENKMKAYEAEGKTVSFVCVGKKGFQILKKTGKVRKTFADIMGTFQMFNAREISQDISSNFMAGGSDQVDLVYGKFQMSFQIGLENLLRGLPICWRENIHIDEFKLSSDFRFKIIGKDSNDYL